MAQSILDRVLNVIQKLKPDELARVRHEVEDRLKPDSSSDEEELFLQALLQAGLITEIKRPNRTKKRDQQPVPIKGRPLSETIIEERR